MSRLFLIAHAATEAQQRAAFPLDEPVLEREVAKISGRGWVMPQAEQVWSAPEQRAQQTACILGLQAIVSPALRDCDYGRWQGRSMEEVQATEPEEILAWLTDPTASPHGGESIENLIARVGAWLEEQRDPDHTTTVAVAHPAIIRSAVIHALHIPAQTFWRFDIAPLSLTDLRFSRGLWTVRCSGCPMQAAD